MGRPPSLRGYKAYLLRVAGKTWEEVAEAVGYSSPGAARTGANSHAMRNGETLPKWNRRSAAKQRKHEKRQAEIERLRLEGWSLQAIGDRFRLSRERVRQLTTNLELVESGASRAARENYEAVMRGEDGHRYLASNYAREHGLPKIPPSGWVATRPCEERDATAYQSRYEGWGWKEIAEWYGYSSFSVACIAVQRHAERHGLKWPLPRRWKR